MLIKRQKLTSISMKVFVLKIFDAKTQGVTFFNYLKLWSNKWQNDLMWIWAWLYELESQTFKEPSAQWLDYITQQQIK